MALKMPVEKEKVLRLRVKGGVRGLFEALGVGHRMLLDPFL